jgi:hypothetical protein
MDVLGLQSGKVDVDGREPLPEAFSRCGDWAADVNQDARIDQADLRELLSLIRLRPER